jgi:tripartite motif-containing protein 9/67
LGAIPLNSGKHYWEVKIDKFVEQEDAIIGVAKQDYDLKSLHFDGISNMKLWGFMSLAGKIIKENGDAEDFGVPAKKDDLIGVLLEFKTENRNLA